MSSQASRIETADARYPGYFLSFEGMDGSGKGTQIELLVQSLASSGFDVVVNREPGGTLIGRQIRAILLDAANSHLLPTAELLLYFASRAQAVEEVIFPALHAGKVVISDRFTDSTLVYQGVARGLGSEVVKQLDLVSCRGLRPDLTLLLDISADTSLARTSARNQATGSSETRFDEESLDFHERVRRAYLALATENSQRNLVVDGQRSIQQVAATIEEAVRSRIAGRLAATERS